MAGKTNLRLVQQLDGYSNCARHFIFVLSKDLKGNRWDLAGEDRMVRWIVRSCALNLEFLKINHAKNFEAPR